MKRFNFFGLILLLSAISFGIEDVKLLRIMHPYDQYISNLNDLGIPLDHAIVRPNGYIEFTASVSEAAALENSGVPLVVLQEDLQSFYANRMTGNITRDFGYGSMGGYYTWEEAVQFLFEIVEDYPTLVSELDTIGYSHEGRPIYALKISDNPNIDEDEPEMLYDAVHHAREPMGMMNLLYFMQHLCQGYGEDPEITAMVDNRELWFVPFVNPDGYVFNYEIAPNGGGMQRKNRQPGCAGTWMGVDLNRNYGFNWNYDNSGSSGDPCNQLYRGPEASSEIEIQILDEFVTEHDFPIMLNYHCYGNVLIYAAGETPYDLPPEPDLSIYREFGYDMAQYNGYLVGSGEETLNYVVNGDADSWYYNVRGIFSYTPEIGASSDGFWPETERIIPLAEENVYPNMFTGWAVGSKYRSEAEFNSEVFIPGETYSFTPHIFNQGLGNSLGDVNFDIQVSDNLSIEFTEINLGSLLGREDIISEPLSFTIAENALSGHSANLTIRIWDDVNYMFVESFEILIGEPMMVYFDDAENGMDNWNTNSWGLSSDSYEGNSSFTDSPTGEYDELSVDFMNLALPLDLTDAADAFLNYFVKWDIEAGYDFGQVLASTNGTNWGSLYGAQMSPGSGSGMQTQGEFGYDGTSDWVEESVSLNEFAGEPYVWIRYQISSDTYVEGDGMYIDNFSVWIYENQSVYGDNNFDGVVDVLDIVSAVNIIINGTELNDEEVQYFDLNNDGVLNVLDVVILVGIIIGN